ncbi:MAG: terminase large subunit [Ruminococcus flavefaciens]|nr:terminase large subunit [Ruminococcus flavefaciens]MCM1232653.1 terminase large subunit [Ruminococcus flavefaciens]
MIKESRAYEYALWCAETDNRYVGAYVRKQAEIWLEIADGNSPDVYVCPKRWKKITKILRLMIHPDLNVNMHDGLEDYAIFFIYAVFCTRSRSDDRRYYQTALLEIARKNFKTFVSAVIFIIGLLTEPRFSRFFSVAPDLKLSSELQFAIRKIIKSSPFLDDEKIFKLLRKEVRCKITDSEYTPLAYSNDKMDGKLANMFLADECGAMDNYPIEAMRSSQITLHEKLGIIISTQYPNDDNAMLDEIDTAKKSLDGILKNQRIFALLYEPDDEYKQGEAWKTEDLAIYQSNPVAYTYEYIFNDLCKKREMAILYRNKRANFLCKHLNIHYSSLGTSGYVDIMNVRQCAMAENPDFWLGRDVYIGLDLSLSDDNTSVAMVTVSDGIIYAMVWGFIPKDRRKRKSEAEKVDYRELIDNGVCFECGDEIIDYLFVENFILNLPEKYGVNIIQLGFDKYNAISSVQKLEHAENPIECVEIRQHSSVLHRPTKLLREHILSGNFRYSENKMLEINFQNARCTYDTNLNLYVNKKKSSGKVDMVVSLINAVYLLQVNELDRTDDDFGCILI